MAPSTTGKGRLANKVAIITGAGTGIGEAICYRFAREGAAIVLNGLADDPVEDVALHVKEQGGRAAVCPGDVSESEHAQACVNMAIEKFDKLDIIVNNAGVFLFSGETQEYPLELFDRTLKMNVRSAFLLTHYALPELQKTRGCLIYAGSEAGELGLANNTAYGGTKGFLHALAKGVAVEQAKHGVRANCVCPGPVDTAWTHHDTGPMDEEMENMVVQATPMGRMGDPEEIANVYLFLASDEASFVTGSLYFVDGGITVGKGPVGEQVPEKLRRPPMGELDLHHQHEGLEHKETETIKH